MNDADATTDYEPRRRTCHTGAMRGPVAFGLVAVLAAAGAAAGCGSPDATSCPRDLPASCPTPAPSYSGQVAAIIHDKCGACHVPGGVEAKTPLETYAEVLRLRTPSGNAILDQVYNCVMPQVGAPQLTSDERQALLTWCVCDDPNN
jgi:mono/diheme cytochrome c family protein